MNEVAVKYMVEIPAKVNSQFKNNDIAIHWGNAFQIITNAMEKVRKK